VRIQVALSWNQKKKKQTKYQMILILKYGKNEHIPPGYNRWGKIIQYEIRNEYLFLI
jgi:hypothetical protein